MRKALLLFIGIGLTVLLNSCSSNDTENTENRISLKLNGVKRTIPAIFVTEDSGIVSVEIEYISFDFPTEFIVFEMNTNGTGNTHLSYLSYQGYLGTGTFDSNSSFLSAVTTDTTKRTIKGTMSGNLVSSESGQNISITNGSFFINY